MKVILNIGIAPALYQRERTFPAGRMAATVGEVMALFKSAYIEHHPRKHGQEESLVVEAHFDGDINLLHMAVDEMARCLNQDCIAFQTLDGKGYLAGPFAVEWQPFDHSYFIYPKESLL